MAQNKKNLELAKKNKNDEFYTTLDDISNEVQNYWPQLEGKKIWCNCDDPEWSQFHNYFTQQKYFHNFEVKFTSYQLIPNDKTGYTKQKLAKPFTKKEGGADKVITTDEVWVDADGFCKGDFRAKEQQALWKWADVIITNPPFSLFREFVDMIMKYKKQFLILGSANAITYKEIFKHIKNDNMWLGSNMPKEFLTTEGERKKFGNIYWYTNLETPIRNRALILSDWDDEQFVRYHNYDAYETIWLGGEKRSGKAVIPFTDKVLGVPISFLTRYCPKQFEILGSNKCSELTQKIKTIQLTGATKGAITTNCKNNIFIKVPKQKANFKNVNCEEYYDVPYERIFIKLKDEWYNEFKETYLG